jgi:hypothetical protein
MNLDSLERTKRSRRIYVRALKSALKSGDTYERHVAKIETKTNDWQEWFRDRMDATGSDNPSDLLPEAFARLEQRNEDNTNAVVGEFKKALGRACQ